MTHGSNHLEEDLDNWQGVQIELVMSIKKSQNTKMIINSRVNSSVFAKHHNVHTKY